MMFKDAWSQTMAMASSRACSAGLNCNSPARSDTVTGAHSHSVIVRARVRGFSLTSRGDGATSAALLTAATCGRQEAQRGVRVYDRRQRGPVVHAVA